jgi:hypothetical protein
MTEGADIIVLPVERVAPVVDLGAVLLAALVGIRVARQGSSLQFLQIVQPIVIVVFQSIVAGRVELTADLPGIGHAVLILVVA